MKQTRQEKIVELVNHNDIETQNQLTQLLKASGFDATQATVSRDIKTLHLKKIPTSKTDSGFKFAVSSELNDQDTDRLNRILHDGLLSMDYAGNILVIKTFNGMAMAVAAALDAMRLPELLGTIAGDDAIFCVVRTEQHAAAVIKKLGG